MRRRNALLCAAVASAVIGAVIGSGAGGGLALLSRSSSPPSSLGADWARPQLEGSSSSWKGPVPILMYHVIDKPLRDAQLPELYVDPKTFTSR